MANGSRPKQELMPVTSGIPDLDQLTAKEREMFMNAFRAGVGAAAAMSPETVGVNVKEYMGTAPNDFRREFSPLPKPAQGGSRRPSQHVDNGHNGRAGR